jgi:hypothetical protein
MRDQLSLASQTHSFGWFVGVYSSRNRQLVLLTVAPLGGAREIRPAGAAPPDRSGDRRLEPPEKSRRLRHRRTVRAGVVQTALTVGFQAPGRRRKSETSDAGSVGMQFFPFSS